MKSNRGPSEDVYAALGRAQLATAVNVFEEEANILPSESGIHFFGYTIEELTRELTNGNSDIAFKLLNIDRNKFARLHTQLLKINYIDYKFLKTEFSILKTIVNPSTRTKLLTCIEKAADIIRSSNEVVQHRDEYSPCSLGLTELDYRTFYRAEEQEHKLDVMKSMYDPKPKESGVEPGFIAIQTEDVLFYLLQTYPNSAHRREFILAHNADIKSIYEEVKSSLPKHMVKLTYEITDPKKIVPREEDLARTTVVKKYKEKSELIGNIVVGIYKYSKTCTPTEKNVEAIQEVLANDVARLFMDVQNQKIYPGTSKHSILQLMLKAEWVKGATTLGPLWGDATGFQNYAATEIPEGFRKGRLTHISDHSIANLGSLLPFFILIGDRDGIGKNGQNKLRDCLRLIGIDFGKAFQTDVKYNKHNFHIINEEFVNYSVFYDVPRTEILRGVFKLARLSNINMDETAIRSYGEDFYHEIMQVKPGADEQIFDDYIKKFQEIKREIGLVFTPYAVQNQECCEEIIAFITTLKSKFISKRNQMVQDALGLLKLDKQIIELAENVEKFVAAVEGKTSLTSPDGTVLLQHIRIVGRGPVCHVEKNQNTFEFSVTYQNAKTKDAISAIIKQNPMLAGFAKANDNRIIFTVNQYQLPLVCKIFHEETLKELYHPHENAVHKALLCASMLERDRERDEIARKKAQEEQQRLQLLEREESARLTRIREEEAQRHREKEELARAIKIREEEVQKQREKEESLRLAKVHEEQAQQQRMQEELARVTKIREESLRLAKIREEEEQRRQRELEATRQLRDKIYQEELQARLRAEQLRAIKAAEAAKISELMEKFTLIQNYYTNKFGCKIFDIKSGYVDNHFSFFMTGSTEQHELVKSFLMKHLVELDSDTLPCLIKGSSDLLELNIALMSCFQEIEAINKIDELVKVIAEKTQAFKLLLSRSLLSSTFQMFKLSSSVTTPTANSLKVALDHMEQDEIVSATHIEKMLKLLQERLSYLVSSGKQNQDFYKTELAQLNDLIGAYQALAKFPQSLLQAYHANKVEKLCDENEFTFIRL